MTDVNKASDPLPHVPQHLFATPCPSGRRPAAPSPESNILVGHASTPAPALPREDEGYDSDVDSPKPAKAKRKQLRASPHAPHLGSFGLDYSSKEIYTSDSSSSDGEDPPPGHSSSAPHPTPTSTPPPRRDSYQTPRHYALAPLAPRCKTSPLPSPTARARPSRTQRYGLAKKGGGGGTWCV